MTATQQEYERVTQRAVETAEKVRQNLLTKAALERFERRVKTLIAERRSFGTELAGPSTRSLWKRGMHP